MLAPLVELDEEATNVLPPTDPNELATEAGMLARPDKLLAAAVPRGAPEPEEPTPEAEVPGAEAPEDAEPTTAEAKVAKSPAELMVIVELWVYRIVGRVVEDVETTTPEATPVAAMEVQLAVSVPIVMNAPEIVDVPVAGILADCIDGPLKYDPP